MENEFILLLSDCFSNTPIGSFISVYLSPPYLFIKSHGVPVMRDEDTESTACLDFGVEPEWAKCADLTYSECKISDFFHHSFRVEFVHMYYMPTRRATLHISRNILS